MFITKTSLSRRTVLRGLGATLALPLLDAMVPALTPTARTAAAPTRRFGAVFVPMGERPSHWTPATTGAGFEFSPILKPLETFRDSRQRRLEPRSAAAGHARRQHRHLADRQRAQAHRGRGLPRRHLARPDHRQADRPGHGVPVARDRHRGLHRLRRRLRRRLQLRLHEHHLVEVADDAAADGDQPARGVRAHVRPARARREERVTRMRQNRSILDSVTRRRRRRSSAASARATRVRLDEYLEHVREIETRIQRAEKQATTRADAAGRAGRHPRLVGRARHA